VPGLGRLRGSYLQSQERNRAIVEMALDGVITIDASGIVTDWDSQTTVLFGWAHEEVMGKLLIARRSFSIVIGRRICKRFGSISGREPAHIGEGYMFSTFIRDITDRRRTEQRLASQYAVI